MVIVLMGVSGCGKTTIGQELSKQTGWKFYDGDDFHSPDNVEKMRNGIPLTDADRAPWLETLATSIKEWNRDGGNAILACSALKADYRRTLGIDQNQVVAVHLKGSLETIRSRLESRSGHYMDPNLLNSQFDTLEEPSDALTVLIDRSPQEIAKEILTRLTS